MSRQDGLCVWTDTVSTALPHLSKPQATVLALWSFGMACTPTCGRTTVAAFLALLLGRKAATVEHQLREWCYEAPAKCGSKRQELDVTTCFVPLLRWIFRPAGQANWYWLRDLVGAEGQRWRGAGTAFKSTDRPLACTLVAWWEAGHKEPWFILTDLDPDGCDAAWYGLRTWCEQGFKIYKRGGWQWPQTRMTDPGR